MNTIKFTDFINNAPSGVPDYIAGVQATQTVKTTGSGLNVLSGTLGGTNAYTLTLTGYSAHTPMIPIYVLCSNTNTGSSTITIGSLAVKNITRFGGNAIQAGDMTNGTIYLIMYDGTQYQILSPVGNTQVQI